MTDGWLLRVTFVEGEGATVGSCDGGLVGMNLGEDDGLAIGESVSMVGRVDTEGTCDDKLGDQLGSCEGNSDGGIDEGLREGISLGATDGDNVGVFIGSIDGVVDRLMVGVRLGVVLSEIPVG